MNVRCGECGRFAARVAYVWGPMPSSGPDHEACDRCRPELFRGDAETAMTRDEITALGKRILAESTAAKRAVVLAGWSLGRPLCELDAAYEVAHSAQLLAARLVLFSDREAGIAEPMIAACDHHIGTRDDRIRRWARLSDALEAVLPIVDADALREEVAP